LSQVKAAGAAKLASKGATVRVKTTNESGKREYTKLDHFLMIVVQFQLKTMGAANIGTTVESEKQAAALLARGMNRSLNSISYKLNEKRPTKIGSGKMDFRGAVQELYNLFEAKGVGTLANGKKSLEEVQEYFEKGMTQEFYQAYTNCFNRVIDVVQAGDVETAGKKGEVRAELPEVVRDAILVADKVTVEDVQEMMEELFTSENIESFWNGLDDIVNETEVVETPVETAEVEALDEAV
jgi:hypothetical protein